MKNSDYFQFIDLAKNGAAFKKTFVFLLKEALAGSSIALARLGYCYADGVFLETKSWSKGFF